MGPFETKAQAEKELKNLLMSNPNGQTKKKVTRKKTLARRVSKKRITKKAVKKKVTRRVPVSKKVIRKKVAKKTAVRRNPGPIRYKLKIGSRFYDGGGLTSDSNKACCFTSLGQARKIGNALAKATGKQVAVHSNRTLLFF